MSCSGLCILCVKQGGVRSIWKYLEAREMSVPTGGIDFFLMYVSMPRLALLKTHTVILV